MLYLASDHAGYKLKEIVKEFLGFLEVEYQDLGTNDDKSVDYPEYANKLAKRMDKKKDKGILFCGTGGGICIAVNRHKGIRGIVGNNEHEVLLGRAHNDANVLCLGGRLIGENMAKKLVKIFLDTQFSKETRHKRRIRKLDKK